MKSELIADVFDIAPCQKGEMLLLRTDGLTDLLEDERIQGVLSSGIRLNEKCARLLELALSENMGRGDNITIILAEF